MRPQAKLTRARELRWDATYAERKLWEELRGRRFEGLKFVRQEPIGPFIADFVCRELKIIVEVDGATHSTDEEIAKDRSRSAYLAREGYRIIRVQNIDVLEGMDGVLESIRRSAERGGGA
jgi:very-short-patch-repair endonuclease